MTTVQVQTQIPDRDELLKLVPVKNFRLVKFFENMAKDVSTTIPDAIGQSLQGPTGGVGDTDVVVFDGTSGFAVKDSGVPIGALALLNSPHFTGVPTAPTATPGTSTTQLATTAFASGLAAGLAPLASPAFTGNPTAPTPLPGDSDTSLATTAFVATSFAPLASPTLTGIPLAPTAAPGTNTTQIATTAFVNANSARSGANSDITSLSGLTTPLSVAQGGTGDAGTAWASAAVTVTSLTGALTTASGTVRFKRIGKTVFFNLAATITTNGTGAGGISITGLPWTNVAATQCMVGREVAVTGKACELTLTAGAATGTIQNYDNTYPAANGTVLIITGVCEAA